MFVYIKGDVSCLFTHYLYFLIIIFKVALVLGKPKHLIMARNLLPIKELFLKVLHNLRNYPRVQDKPIENPKLKARRKVEKTVFKKYFFRNKNIYHHIHKLILYIYLEFVTFSSKTWLQESIILNAVLITLFLDISVVKRNFMKAVIFGPIKS